MQITINGELSADPKSRVLALEAVVQSICERFDQDPAEGIMMLLTAAVHMASKHSGKPAKDLIPALASSLGAATVAAHEFFTLRVVGPGEPKC